MMWICGNCGAEVESDDWDTCWNCRWSRTGEPPAPDTPPPSPEALVCLRCRTSLRFVGTRRFNERAPIARLVLDNLSDLFLDSDEFDLYVCPRCDHVEFFLSKVGAEQRPRGDESIP